MRLGDSAGRTDAGRVRRRNEDAFVLDPPLFAVADGMGGAQAGEVASRLAAAAFREYHDADRLEPAERVEAIIKEANRRIYERARTDSEASGMGTTVTAAILTNGHVSIGHVGDSRAYRVRGGELERLTEDHSLVADLMRSGRLTPEEADAHPQRSVITRALGTDADVDVDMVSVDVEPGDLFLLCSDGLTTMVPEDDILRIVRDAGTLDDVARTLVRAANSGGGEDNITVVLFQVVGDEAVEETLVAAPTPDTVEETNELEDTLRALPRVLRRGRRGRQRHRLPGRAVRLQRRRGALPRALREPPPGRAARARGAGGPLRPPAGLVRPRTGPRVRLRGRGRPLICA
jgi:PPM family protein phosphatase